jgi:hypothetical protein
MQYTYYHMRGAEAFEKQLAESFRKQGYNPELTPTSSDRGIDILLHSGRETIAVQAKYYSAGNNVGSPIIQKASGLLQRRDIDGVVVVTTSGFTDEAQTVASNRGVQLLYATSNGRLKSSGVAGAAYERKKNDEIGRGIKWEERDAEPAPEVTCPNCGEVIQRTGWFAYVFHFEDCKVPKSKPHGLPADTWETVKTKLRKRGTDVR